jgi:hypothetical protein
MDENISFIIRFELICGFRGLLDTGARDTPSATVSRRASDNHLLLLFEVSR